ncbi:MAG: phosphatase PAP2 family protein [Bacteroidota bacterium]
MNRRVANILSIFGHPLLTAPAFAIFMFFKLEDVELAFKHSIIIILGIFLPLSIRMYVNTKKGVYTNFDVSDQGQRQSWYIFATILLSVFTLYLFITGQPQNLCYSVAASLILLVISQCINFYIKSSLHVSVNVFLAFLMMSVSVAAGIMFLLFAGFVAQSRLVLGRHTIREIIVGALVGLIVGFIILVIMIVRLPT